MSRGQPSSSTPAPVLIEYRDLVRCHARIDGIFKWQGWEEAPGEERREVLFIHHRRLGCYRGAGASGGHRLGCAGMSFPFGDFVVTLETVVEEEESQGQRIESELQLFFFGLGDERRRDLWSGRVVLAAGPDGSLTTLDLGPAAGVLERTSLLRRLRRRRDCRADVSCWQVALATAVLDTAVDR